MSAPDNPPAFPVHLHCAHPFGEGMTLLDWFAGQALAGQLANSSARCDNFDENGAANLFARDAYILANAMLAERAKVQS